MYYIENGKMYYIKNGKMYHIETANALHRKRRFEDVPGAEQQCRIKKQGGRKGGDNTSLSPGELASLWGVDEAVLKTGVMRRTVTAGGTSASISLNAAQVCWVV